MKRLVLVTLLAVSLGLTGCITASNGLSPSSTPLEGKDYTVVGDTVSNSWAFYLLGILPLSEANPTAGARDRAVANLGGDGLIDCTTDTTVYMLPFLFVYKTQITGKVVKFVD